MRLNLVIVYYGIVSRINPDSFDCRTGSEAYRDLIILRSEACIITPIRIIHKSISSIQKSTIPINSEIPIKVDIASEEYIFWTDTFFILVKEPVGIEDFTEPIARIYPNPVGNQVNIDFQSGIYSKTCIELLDISGKAVYVEKLEAGASSTHTINLSAFAEGIYLIKISSAHYCITKKLLKIE